MTAAGFNRVQRGHEVRLQLSRPDARNALDLPLIEGLTHAIQTLPADCRVLVLEGTGRAFCAGADLQWMQAAQHASDADNRADAHKLAALFAALAHCPQAVLALVQGPVRGGGVGLVAAADVAVASACATFAFTEVRLGLLPAVIAPTVIARIGMAAARALFLSAETFDAGRALALGLVHEQVAQDQLQARGDALVRALCSAAPEARAATKALLRALAVTAPGDQESLCVDALAKVRTGAEARAGLAAFFARTQPPWMGPAA